MNEHYSGDLYSPTSEDWEKTSNHVAKIREADSRGLPSELISLLFFLAMVTIVFYQHLRPQITPQVWGHSGDTVSTSTVGPQMEFVHRYSMDQGISEKGVNLLLGFTIGGLILYVCLFIGSMVHMVKNDIMPYYL